MSPRCLTFLLGLIALSPVLGESSSIALRLEQARDPGGRMVLVAAHRGGYETDREDQAPENTLANLEVAIRKGYDVYETDIKRTRDGVFVIVHDPTIDRETTGSGPVDRLTLAELRKLRKRYRDGSVSEVQVATLEELLLAGKGRILFKPDLKPGVVEHFDALARLVVRLGMQDHVMIRTGVSDAKTIQTAFHSGTPKVEVMFKLATAEHVQKIQRDFAPRTVEVRLAKGEVLSSQKLAAIREAWALGILVETHAYNDEAVFSELAELGVRMFHTASPAKTLRWLEQNNWRQPSP